MKIAILGATSHVAKWLIYFLSRNKKHELFLFARNQEKTKEFLKSINSQSHNYWFEEFNNFTYEVIINCVWFWNPSKLKEAWIDVFRVNERFDNIVIDYLYWNKDVLYINFSSWATYWTDFKEPVDEWSMLKIDINNLNVNQNYLISKLNSETKHRTLKEFNIVDLRLFSYFSRFIDLESGFLLTDIINAIKNKKTLITSQDDIIRDYISFEDLWNIIELLIKNKKNNICYDIYSLSPVKKFEILNFCKDKYGLDYKIISETIQAPTWAKNIYYSKYHLLENLWYKPIYTSIENIKNELKIIIK